MSMSLEQAEKEYIKYLQKKNTRNRERAKWRSKPDLSP